MVSMSRTHRIKFWLRNGFDIFEAIYLSEKPLTREVVLGLKKLRKEVKKRKKNG